MNEFNKVGELSITGTVLHTGTNGSFLSKLTAIKFNNPAAYQLTISLYKADTSLTTVLYTLTLDAGDIVNDQTVYQLNDGDQLIATSNIVGTNYYAAGADY